MVYQYAVLNVVAVFFILASFFVQKTSRIIQRACLAALSTAAMLACFTKLFELFVLYFLFVEAAQNTVKLFKLKVRRRMV